jgi:hypothetical protein
VGGVLTDLSSYRDWNPLSARRRDRRRPEQDQAAQRPSASGRLMTVKPKITVAAPGAELRWTASLPGITSGEHSFVPAEADGGTWLTQSETFGGLLVAFSGKTLARAEASFRELNEALKKRAEAG